MHLYLPRIGTMFSTCYKYSYLLTYLAANANKTKLSTLTIWFIFTLTELVRVVVGVACLRSQFRRQFKDGDSHLTRLKM